MNILLADINLNLEVPQKRNMGISVFFADFICLWLLVETL